MWLEIERSALASVALLERGPVNRKVVGLIPGQGADLGCGFGPWSGHVQEATDGRFPFSLPPFPCLYLKNKQANKQNTPVGED